MNNNVITAILIGLISTFMSSMLLAYDNASLTDHEIDSRLQYIENQFLNIERPYENWQYGWTAAYSGLGAMKLYQANNEDDKDRAIKERVAGVKLLAGLALVLIKPVPMIAGMNDYKKMPQLSRKEKIQRLNKAETMLKQTAWRADDRYTFKPHVMTIGLNIIGAAAIIANGDSSDALASAALGIAIGEAAIWTQPTSAEKKLNDYQERFGDKKKNTLTWKVNPFYNGVKISLLF